MKNFWAILILFCIPVFLLYLFQSSDSSVTAPVQSQIPEEITAILEEKSLPLISSDEEAKAVKIHLSDYNNHHHKQLAIQLATQNSLMENPVQTSQINNHQQILNHIPCLKCCQQCPSGDKLHSGQLNPLNYNHYYYPKTKQLKLKCDQNAHLQRKCEWVCDCNNNKPVGKCTNRN